MAQIEYEKACISICECIWSAWLKDKNKLKSASIGHLITHICYRPMMEKVKVLRENQVNVIIVNVLESLVLQETPFTNHTCNKVWDELANPFPDF